MLSIHFSRFADVLVPAYLPVTQNLEATCWYVVIVVAVQQTVITLFI